MVSTGLIAVELLAEVQGVLRMAVRLFAGTGADGALHVVQSFGLHGAGHSGQIVARNDSHWGATLIMRAGARFRRPVFESRFKAGATCVLPSLSM